MNASNKVLKPPSDLNILEHVPLASYSSWKVGGAARWLSEPSVEKLPKIMRWAAQEDVQTYFLGCSSNVLISDDGLPGLVIITRNSMTELKRIGNCIEADSGVFLPHLSRFAAKEGYAGFEFLIGIPGTVGGALAMNAGLTVFHPREMVTIVKDFDVIDRNGRVETLTMDSVNAEYRKTSLIDDEKLVLKVRFRLEEKGSPKQIRRSTLEHLAERKRKQPLNMPTAGSTFKSPAGCKGAGWYIEQAGLKGTEIGGARVSQMHANWIENTGEATATDIRQLICHIQETVEKKVGIRLEPEVVML